MRIGATGRGLLRLVAGWWLAVHGALALAQPVAPPVIVEGLLAKARSNGTVTIGYREDSIPFSYLSPRGEPIGYSIDLCRLLVDAVGDEVGKAIAIKWQAVTPASRTEAVASGRVDLECGSTTSNLERQRRVAFSPAIFVSGTKLLVRKDSPIRSFRDLSARRVVVTEGTTNEKTMRELARKFALDIDLRVAPDHAASYALLATGQVDAFATDDVLLYGLVAQRGVRADYVVAGDFLSYEPYGVMYRKNDPQFARLLTDTFRQLAESGEIERRYERWFLHPAPGVPSLDLPMSPQLDTLIQAIAQRAE